MTTPRSASLVEAAVWHSLDEIADPEMPALSITDLGIVRGVSLDQGECVITITPTYSGCPALQMISATIVASLSHLGFTTVSVKTVLSPAWSSDWLSDEAKARLVADGIAAPHPVALVRNLRLPVACPRCASSRTGLLTQFSSTSCKALYRCLDCLEPFDYFKPH